MTGDLRPRRLDPARLKPLQDWLAGALEARAVAITGAEILGGGAIGENWLIRAEVEGGARAGSHDWVLRTDAVARLDISHDRTHEFALIKAAHAAGVKVPEPVATCPDEALIGAPFMIVGRVAGTAQGRALVRDAAVAANREALVHEIGRQLARIHSIRPPRDDLSFLPLPEEAPALAQIALLRRCLDGVSSPQPALEFILSWLEERAPDAGEIVLCHTDFRTGNIMIDQGRLTGILDWEFCHWGDPHFDLAWFCARCWRFGADAWEAGGLGPRQAFYEGYRAEGGIAPDPEQIAYWEIMSAARWAAIALLQGERHISGGEPSIELLLTGLMAPEMQYDALAAIVAQGES